jgi:hypothetical protein
MKAPSVKPVRCAIYTRVSTEHGLDQEFNSLDAQYDAASAYIKSQAHAGWTLIRSRYDDGGYSGGSTDRPDLQRLLVCAVRYEPVSGGNSLLTGKLTGNFAILGPQKPISLHETTVLQRLFTKFPTQINRENILKNREFLSGNREFHLLGG